MRLLFSRLFFHVSFLKNLKNYFENSEEISPILSEIFNSLYTNISLEETIYRIIDSADHISDHASPELLRIRKQIKSEENTIQEKLQGIYPDKEITCMFGGQPVYYYLISLE